MEHILLAGILAPVLPEALPVPSLPPRVVSRGVICVGGVLHRAACWGGLCWGGVVLADHLGQPAELVSKAGQSQPGPAVLAEGCSFCNFSGQTGQRQAGCRRSGRLGGQVWEPAPLQRCDGTPDLPLLRPLTGGRWPGFRCRRLGCQPWCQLG